MFLCRYAGTAERYEPQAGGDTEVPGHVPGDETSDLPTILLPVQRRLARDPWTVQEPGGSAASFEEMFRQHQDSKDGQG